MPNVALKERFEHTVEKVVKTPSKPNIIAHDEWLRNNNVPHCKLLSTLPGRPRFGFTCKEDRNIFLLEFLGEYRIEQEQFKSRNIIFRHLHAL